MCIKSGKEKAVFFNPKGLTLLFFESPKIFFKLRVQAQKKKKGPWKKNSKNIWAVVSKKQSTVRTKKKDFRWDRPKRANASLGVLTFFSFLQGEPKPERQKL